LSDDPKSDFERLLEWLGPGRDEAAQKYEHIRSSLISYFRRRGATDPASLADEVFVRIARKADGLSRTFVGEQTHYCLAVARRVLAESRRHPPTAELPHDLRAPDLAAEADAKESLSQSLEQCWQKLKPEERDILERYYLETPPLRLSESREELARELGLTVNALRVMSHRIRARLRRCIERLAGEKTEMTAPFSHQ